MPNEELMGQLFKFNRVMGRVNEAYENLCKAQEELKSMDLDSLSEIPKTMLLVELELLEGTIDKLSESGFLIKYEPANKPEEV